MARNVTALSTSPPGLYVDESSIAYNAWAVAHFGVDEHGYRLPLYFEAFTEYKNPLYIYALVPLARLLPLSAALERFPAAMFGLATTLFITLAAWRITRSRAITLFTLALAALTPWLVQESRVGFEVIAMVTTLSVALWCLADDRATTPRRFGFAGLFLMLSIFAYSTGRLEVLLFTAMFTFIYARRGRRRAGWWRVLVVVAAGYLVLGVWALLHPGALTAEFSIISIGADGASWPTVVGRFITNYIGYFGPDFLFVHGDPNLRHNTGYAGMLLAITAPLLLLGIWGCWRRRREALPRFTLLCLAVGPIAGSLTNGFGAPHALRGAVMLPFWLLLAVYGLDAARGVLARHRILPVAIAGALAVQGGLFLLDMYTAYPVRAAQWFGDGVPAAIAAAAAAAHGHTVHLSTSFEEPYIQAFFALQPAPPAQPTEADAAIGLTLLGMTIDDPTSAAANAQPGDVLVLAAGDPPPQRATVIATEFAPRDPLAPGSPQPEVYVYRVAAAAP